MAAAAVVDGMPVRLVMAAGHQKWLANFRVSDVDANPAICSDLRIAFRYFGETLSEGRVGTRSIARQKGLIPSSFAALAWAIFSFTVRGRSTARSQSAPSRLLTNG